MHGQRFLQQILRILGFNAGPPQRNSLANVDISGFPEPSTEALSLIDRSMVINAIKLYRQQTGLGLKEARDVIMTTRAMRR